MSEEPRSLDEEPEEDELRRIAAEAMAPVDEGDTKPSKLIGRLVLFPLALAVVGVVFTLVLALLTQEDTTPREYLDSIRVGGINSRWQAAYELSKLLVTDEGRKSVTPDFVDAMVGAFEESRTDDTRVRRYLALALGRLKDPAIVPALISALQDPDEETRIYAILSLGAQADARALGPLTEAMRSEDAGIRKAAVFALGHLEHPEAQPALAVALTDPAPDVRWNAALQLGRARDKAGMTVLHEMLDRRYLETLSEMSEEQRGQVMIEAIQMAHYLDARSLSSTLQTLRVSDPNLRVRQAAIDVLSNWNG